MNDCINGCFEFAAAGFQMLNVLQLMRDKQVKGFDWRSVAFFSSWGIWNLFYYPSLGQWMSFAGGLAIVAVNLSWLVLMFWYTTGQQIRYPSTGSTETIRQS